MSLQSSALAALGKTLEKLRIKNARQNRSRYSCLHLAKEPLIIAGPCAVESEKQINLCAMRVQAAGAGMLRGGLFKPRSSPYSFTGLGRQGLPLLRAAGKSCGLPIVSELMDSEQIEEFAPELDVIQIGARNMQNFNLLKAAGATGKAVLLKRGFASTIEEWLLAAEHIMLAGPAPVLLCERGLRSFDPLTRNLLDISAIPLVKSLCNLPVLADPSHAAGLAFLVEPLGLAALAAGADGLLVECCPEPAKALSDGQQSLDLEAFDRFMARARPLAAALGKRLG